MEAINVFVGFASSMKQPTSSFSSPGKHARGKSTAHRLQFGKKLLFFQKMAFVASTQVWLPFEANKCNAIDRYAGEDP